MHIGGPEQLLRQVIKNNLCVGCGACASLCPYFEVYKGKSSMIFPCDRDQGQCHAYCPQTETVHDALSAVSPLGSYRRIVIAKSGEKITGDAFQNGGTVSALMKFALENKQIDAAILTRSRDLEVVPEVVTDPEEVVSFASSKYMAAPVVSKVVEGCKQGFSQIGVVGTPCQITALAKMKTNPLGREEIPATPELTIGLFCTWSLETRKFSEFLKEKAGNLSIRGMDIPPPPAETFVLKTDQGETHFPLSEIRTMIQEGCGACSDMTAQWADISVGAFEENRAFNTVIIRSEAGEKMVEEAVSQGYLTVEPFPEDLLPGLEKAAGNKRSRAEEMRREISRRETTEESELDPSVSRTIVGFR